VNKAFQPAIPAPGEVALESHTATTLRVREFIELLEKHGVKSLVVRGYAVG